MRSCFQKKMSSRQNVVCHKKLGYHKPSEIIQFQDLKKIDLEEVTVRTHGFYSCCRESTHADIYGISWEQEGGGLWELKQAC